MPHSLSWHYDRSMDTVQVFATSATSFAGSSVTSVMPFVLHYCTTAQSRHMAWTACIVLESSIDYKDQSCQTVLGNLSVLA